MILDSFNVVLIFTAHFETTVNTETGIFRTREDTVRQIVAGLTGDAEGCTDLASELSRGDPVTLEMQDSDEEGTDPEDWTPDPTDAVPGERTCAAADAATCL